jgi:hypothetical protein
MKHSVRDPAVNTKALNAFELYEPVRVAGFPEFL